MSQNKLHQCTLHFDPITDQNGSELLMNYRLCRKSNIVATMKLRTLEWAGRLVRMADDRTVRTYLWGNQTEEEGHADQN